MQKNADWLFCAAMVKISHMERKYTGIVLGKYNIKESDRIYTIYTLEAGKIKVIAQGVRKPQAKLAGHLEDFNLIDLTVVRKKGMGRIAGSIIENNFSYLRNNLDALKCAFTATRIVSRLTEAEDKDEGSFWLLLQLLEALDKEAQSGKNNFEILLQGFIFNLFGNLGYKIEANGCVRCASFLSENGSSFSPELGGIICQQCSGEVKNAIEASGNAIKLIRIFPQNKIGTLAKLRVEKNDLGNLEVISGRFLEWIKN